MSNNAGNLAKIKGRRYWRVKSGYSNNDREHQDLGVHFGSLSEVAWHLADKAQGFWMDHGYLEFHPVPAPADPQNRLKPGKSRRVNISVYPTERRKELTMGQLAELLDDDGSRLEPSNYYAQTYLVR